MSAEPAEVEDPNDPAVILRDLSEQERAEFLRQYHAAVDAAHDPAGYRQLQGLLHAWRLTVIATSRAGYYEELAAVRSGTAQARPAEEVFPGWQQRLAASWPPLKLIPPATARLCQVRDPRGHSYLTELPFSATLRSTEPDRA